jgi:amino acid transporter
MSPGKYGIAFVAGYFSYTGWQSLNNIVEEIKNPNRQLFIVDYLDQ